MLHPTESAPVNATQGAQRRVSFDERLLGIMEGELEAQRESFDRAIDRFIEANSEQTAAMTRAMDGVRSEIKTQGRISFWFGGFGLSMVGVCLTGLFVLVGVKSYYEGFGVKVGATTIATAPEGQPDPPPPPPPPPLGDTADDDGSSQADTSRGLDHGPRIEP